MHNIYLCSKINFRPVEHLNTFIKLDYVKLKVLSQILICKTNHYTFTL